ncbi:MAG: tyrosine-type recombinase/integrase [Actinoallomurus sp.]
MPYSVSAENCASSRPRPKTPNAPSRCQICASRPSKAHKERQRTTAPTPGRTGRSTTSSSHPASAHRSSRTTSEEAGAASARPPRSAVRFHAIRHTCVSLLLDLGVPPHIVGDIVGHSDIEVTTTIYAHAALDEKRKATRQAGERP